MDINKTLTKGDIMINDFLQFCQENGYNPENITFTNGGPAKRFDHGKSKKTGFYYLDDLGDDRCIGVVGDWSRGINNVDTFTNFSKKKMKPKDKKRMDEAIQKNKDESKAAEKKRQKEAADESKLFYGIATDNQYGDIPETLKMHPYMKNKGINSGFESFDIGCINDAQENSLIIPMYNKDNEIVSLQRIHDNGFKQFATGGQVRGTYSFLKHLKNSTFTEGEKLTQPVGESILKMPESRYSEDVFIVEGWATGEIINRATRARTYVAFTASNLINTTKMVRERHPGRRVVVCADNDQWPKKEGYKGPENPGIHYANEAVKGIKNSMVIWPHFNKDDARVSDHTDYNDFYILEGEGKIYAEIKGGIQRAEQTKEKGRPLSLADIMDMDIEVVPLIDGLMNMDDSLIIHAAGGTGKSSLSMQLGLCLAAGHEFLKTFPIPEPKNILFIQSEYEASTVKVRVNEMLERDPALTEGLGKIFFHKTREGSITSRGSFTDNRDGDNAFMDDLRLKIGSLMEDYGIKIEVAIIDPYVSFTDVDEQDNVGSRKTLDNITDLCAELEITPILIHHDNKAGGYRGGTSIHDWTRSRVHIFGNRKTDRDGIPTDELHKPDLHGDALILRHEKWNNGPLFGVMYLKRSGISFFERVQSIVTDFHGDEQPKKKYWDDKLKNLLIVLSLDFGGWVQTKAELKRMYSDTIGTSSESGATRKHVERAIKEGHIVKNISPRVQIHGDWVDVMDGFIVSPKGYKILS